MITILEIWIEALKNWKTGSQKTVMQAKTYTDVLRMYKIEDLPEFSEIELIEVNQRGNFGNLPIHVACIRGDINEVTLLIAGGADVNAAGELGNTPLHEAAGQWHPEIIKILLSNGADGTAKNDFGSTAFDIAKEKGFQLPS